MNDLKLVFTDDLGNERTIFAKDIKNFPYICMTAISKTEWEVIDVRKQEDIDKAGFKQIFR